MNMGLVCMHKKNYASICVWELYLSIYYISTREGGGGGGGVIMDFGLNIFFKTRLAEGGGRS